MRNAHYLDERLRLGEVEAQHSSGSTEQSACLCAATGYLSTVPTVST
jgi:hypothetical protein